MDCPGKHHESTSSFLDRFGQRVVAERIPISGGMNITDRCNLRCVHCYISDQPRAKELDTRQIISLIDTVTNAGCLYLFFTGGEPLLRTDFRDIYRHARKNGIIVVVFTNATLVDAPLIETFHEYPPQAVEVSLYGASEKVYESVTTVKGSYKKCLTGIERLLAADIRVNLKTVLLTLNFDEYEAMESLAKSYGTNFRTDPAVFPRLDGNKDPLSFRVPPKDVVQKEFSSPEKAGLFKKYYADTPLPHLQDTLFNCGAGLTNFHIDSSGNLMPCVLGQPYAYNLLSGSFSEGWQQMKEIRGRNASWIQCNGCDNITLCGCCSGVFRLENGTETSVSGYTCEIGRERLHFIRSMG